VLIETSLRKGKRDFSRGLSLTPVRLSKGRGEKKEEEGGRIRLPAKLAGDHPGKEGERGVRSSVRQCFFFSLEREKKGGKKKKEEKKRAAQTAHLRIFLCKGHPNPRGRKGGKEGGEIALTPV